MKRKMFFCTTYYHVLISIIKMFFEKEKAEIAICMPGNDAVALADKIQEKNIFEKVWTFKNVEEYTYHNIFERLISGHRKNAAYIEKQIDTKAFLEHDIYIFHDDTWISHYLQDCGISYHLIEDALDSYQIIDQTVWFYMANQPKWKIFLKKMLHFGYLYAGASPYTIDVEVNCIDGVKIPCTQKLIEQNRRKMFEQMTDEQRQIVREIFMDEQDKLLEKGKGRKVLLLTQPLSADKVVMSNQEQIHLYQQILLPYERGNLELYIKPHPRDEVDYTEVFKKAVILKKSMPVEVLDLIDDIYFDVGISFFSTALKGLMCVKQKKYYEIDKVMKSDGTN